MADRLDTPLEARHRFWHRPSRDDDGFGRVAEGIARFVGSPRFIMWMTIVVVVWLGWNTLAPEQLQFDPRATNFTLLTLILSLQASYASPLILLAQDRQADRDRVSFEQDRVRSERNLADTEYLAREMAALRVALGDVATRDFVRSELRNLFEELGARAAEPLAGPSEGTQDSPPPGLATRQSGSNSELDLPPDNSENSPDPSGGTGAAAESAPTSE